MEKEIKRYFHLSVQNSISDSQVANLGLVDWLAGWLDGWLTVADDNDSCIHFSNQMPPHM